MELCFEAQPHSEGVEIIYMLRCAKQGEAELVPSLLTVPLWIRRVLQLAYLPSGEVISQIQDVHSIDAWVEALAGTGCLVMNPRIEHNGDRAYVWLAVKEPPRFAVLDTERVSGYYSVGVYEDGAFVEVPYTGFKKRLTAERFALRVWQHPTRPLLYFFNVPIEREHSLALLDKDEMAQYINQPGGIPVLNTGRSMHQPNRFSFGSLYWTAHCLPGFCQAVEQEYWATHIAIESSSGLNNLHASVCHREEVVPNFHQWLDGLDATLPFTRQDYQQVTELKAEIDSDLYYLKS